MRIIKINVSKIKKILIKTNRPIWLLTFLKLNYSFKGFQKICHGTPKQLESETLCCFSCDL